MHGDVVTEQGNGVSLDRVFEIGFEGIEILQVEQGLPACPPVPWRKAGSVAISSWVNHF